jgi:hypothetical protein
MVREKKKTGKNDRVNVDLPKDIIHSAQLCINDATNRKTSESQK